MFTFRLLPVQLLRDGKWSEQDAVLLVPGDIISIKLGDIVPADCRLLQGDPLKIDQVTSALLFAFPFPIRREKDHPLNIYCRLPSAFPLNSIDFTPYIYLFTRDHLELYRIRLYRVCI